MSKFSRNFTVSPDVIQGGTKSNVICAETTAQIDVRYVEPEDLERFNQRDPRSEKANSGGILLRLQAADCLSSLNEAAPSYRFRPIVKVLCTLTNQLIYSKRNIISNLT